MARSWRYAVGLAGVVGALVAFNVTSNAQSLISLSDFSFRTGGHPYAAVVFDNVPGRPSVLYTTTAGAAGACYEKFGCGSIVSLTPPKARDGDWTLKVLHVFTGPDGDVPYGGLIFDSFGSIYGTTTHGGTLGLCAEGKGCGTVFKLTPPEQPDGRWTLTTIYRFSGPDGALPVGTLTFDSFGSLYGSTTLGGAYGHGIVFKLTPPATEARKWSQSVVYAFGGKDGARPRGQPIFDTQGALYTSTQLGGAMDMGTVVKLTPPATVGGVWTNTVLHHFAGANGCQPFNSLQFDTTGALYGTTWKGGIKDNGVAFKLTPPDHSGEAWSESYYKFDGRRGSTLQSGLSRDTFGTFYGTTNRGGTGDCAKTHCGTVYKLIAPTTPDAAWTHTVLADFDGVNGGDPEITPVFHLGALYGTADYGGSSNLGTIWEYTPSSPEP